MTSQEPGDVRLCILLACFAGRKHASKVHRAIGKRIRGNGDSVLEEVIVTVDPRRLRQPPRLPSDLTPGGPGAHIRRECARL